MLTASRDFEGIINSIIIMSIRRYHMDTLVPFLCAAFAFRGIFSGAELLKKRGGGEMVRLLQPAARWRLSLPAGLNFV